MDASRLAELQESLQQEGLAGWLFCDHHGRDPLAYRILGLPREQHVSRRWFYLIPAHGDPSTLMHRIEPGVLAGLPGRQEHYSTWPQISDWLRRELGGGGRIAMQYSPLCSIPVISMVDAGTLELVRAAGAEVVTSANLIQLFEARWSPQQLATHQRAGVRMDAIRASTFAHIAERRRAGEPVNELSVQAFVREAFSRDELITDHGPIIAFGPHSGDPHYEPTAGRSRTLHDGDVVLVDMWAKVSQPEAVYYDITWVGFAGPTVPERVQEVFSAVVGARDAAVTTLRTAHGNGMVIRGYEVDDAARDHLRQRGFAEHFVHRTGHSIGVDVHGAGANMDNLESHDDRIVTPRTGFSVEPGVYLPDFGIRSELNVYMGEDGPRVTGEVQGALLLV